MLKCEKVHAEEAEVGTEVLGRANSRYGTGRFGRHLLTWNAGTCCGYARTNAVDDVGFVIALLADLAARTLVDHTR